MTPALPAPPVAVPGPRIPVQRESRTSPQHQPQAADLAGPSGAAGTAVRLRAEKHGHQQRGLPRVPRTVTSTCSQVEILSEHHREKRDFFFLKRSVATQFPQLYCSALCRTPRTPSVRVLCSRWAAGLRGNKNRVSPVATKRIHSLRSPFVATESDMLSKRAKGFGCDELSQCGRKLFRGSVSDQLEWSWNGTGRVRGGRGGFCRPCRFQTLRSGFRAASAKPRQSCPQQQLVPVNVRYRHQR